jgi:glyoxylase-like metal-dependent hydrolase (beta-lactamase superfamily II)
VGRTGPWTEGGPEPVAPGVFRIPLPLPTDGLRAVNVYVIETDSGLVLIDSGWALDEARAELDRGVKALGHELSDVRVFLVTHVHRDHYTQAVALRHEFGSRVLLGAGERASLRLCAEPGLPQVATQLRLLRRSGAAPLARQIADSLADPEDPRLWEDPDEWIAGDSRIPAGGRVLDAIHTPGHTYGHVVFRDAEAGLLFAGDHVLPHITPSIGFEPAPGPLPLASYLDSLRRVRELPDTRLLPAHGPVTGSVHQRVDELLAHHATRLAETQAAVAAGASTAAEVAVALTWTRRRRPFGDFDPFNQMLAINETAAHLDVLVAQGGLVALADGALRHYQLSATEERPAAARPARE